MQSSEFSKSPADIELQAAGPSSRDAVYNDPLASLPVLERSGLRSTRNLNVVEMPTQERAPETNESENRKARKAGLVQMAALCWMMFLVGWNDGVTGPLLPRIQEVYHVYFNTYLILKSSSSLTIKTTL
jgi:hypothetical protein